MKFIPKNYLNYTGILLLLISLGAYGGRDGALLANINTNNNIHISLNNPSIPPSSLSKAQTPPGTILTISLASRVQGVAPLAVYFDAINVPGVAQPPLVNGRREYADYYYKWNFGDSTSGTWAVNGTSKNRAKGYAAAHVFEKPGTYTVTLNVKDGSTVDEVRQVTITVDDPDTVYAGGATICVSSIGNYSGCPSGAQRLTTTAITDIGGYIKAGRRILFRRGDTWTTSGVVNPGNAGPLTFGAYGTCLNSDDLGICSNAPKINISAKRDAGFFNFKNQKDARMMDIFVNNSNKNGTASGGGTGLERLLFLRMRSEGFDIPFVLTHWDTRGHDQIAFFENKFSNSRTNLVYVGSERLMIMGNRFRVTENSHILRVWQAYKGVIAHNELSGASSNSTAGRHALKLHGPTESVVGNTGASGLDYRTRFVQVDNNLIGGSGPWPMAVGPINTQNNEFLQDIVIEDNRVFPGWGSQGPMSVKVDLTVWASYVTVRNNIFSGAGAAKDFTGVTVTRRGVEPAPVGVRVLNNTIYKASGTGANNYIGVRVGTPAKNTVVKNNFVHFNQNGLNTMIKDSGVNSIKSGNILTNSPGLVDPDNTNFMAKDFKLKLGSPAIGKGSKVPVFVDRAGVSRTLGAGSDVGAYKYK